METANLYIAFGLHSVNNLPHSHIGLRIPERNLFFLLICVLEERNIYVCGSRVRDKKGIPDIRGRRQNPI
jgi:hypothetical protein